MATRRRQLRTPSRNVVATVDRRRIEPKTKQAFLALDYPGIAQSAFVQFSDPTFVRSNVLQARLRAGLGGIPLRAGTPVTVQISHGQVEIVGLPSGGTSAQAADTSDVALPADASPATATFGVEPLTELPDLPNEDYPPGAVVNLITEGKDFKNVDDDWESTVDAVDMPDLSATIGLSGAGAIYDPVTGLPILLGNTDPNLDFVGAQPFLRSHWERLVRNGDFHDAPPFPDLPINNTDNVLPGWAVQDGTGGLTNAYSVEDATSGSGRRIDIIVSNGSTGTFLLVQNMDVRSTATRNSAALISFSASCASPPASTHYMVESSALEKDSTGTFLRQYVPSWDVNVLTGTAVDLYEPAGQANLRPETASVDIGVGIVQIGSAVSTFTVSIQEVQLVVPDPFTAWPDLVDPNNPPALSKYENGVWTLTADSVSIPNLAGGGTPKFTTVDLGGVTDATLARPSAGNVSVEGNLLYRAGGTDVPVTDGGTGASTQAGARSNLGLGTVSTQDASAVAITGGTGASLTLSDTSVNGEFGLTGGATSTLTGSQVDVVLAAIRSRWNGASASTWHGIVAPVLNGSVHVIYNVTAAQSLTIKHLSATEATAANKIVCPNGLDLVVGPNTAIWLMYDATTALWRVIAPAALIAANNLSDVASAATAATNLGLGTGNSPQFAAVNIGAATDTTVDRLSAGDIEVEGNRIFRVGGADVPVADGGTGASTAASARSNLGSTTVGDAVFIAANTAAARTAIGTVIGTDVSAFGHSVADHTDVSRFFWLDAADARLESGVSSATTVGAAPDQSVVIAFPDAATTGCFWKERAPSDMTNATSLQVRPIWAPGSTDAAAHAARWAVTCKVLVNGNDVTAAGTTVNATGTAAARTANNMVNNEADIDTTVTPAGTNDVIVINFRRIGANAADTYVGTINLLGLRVGYTASQ